MAISETTFTDLITGKTRPNTGRVLWGERSISVLNTSESQIARQGIGHRFQRPTVFKAQSVRENLEVALRSKCGPFDVLLSRRPKDAQGKTAGCSCRNRPDDGLSC